MRSALLGLFCLGCGAASVAEAPSPNAAGGSDDGGGASASAEGGADVGGAVDANPPPPGLRVLFIGNSYTFVNDLPKELSALAATPGAAPRITTQMIAPGGATLASHWNGAEAQAAIAKGGFSHVVMQGQSVEPLLQPTVFEDYALKFGAAAIAAGAAPAYFQTWARAPGDAVYAEKWSGGTPSAMQDGLSSEYQKMASASKGVLVKVGEAWRVALRDHPSIALHQSDGSHPSAAGTLLAVYTFYTALTGRDVPRAAAVPLGVAPADASALRAVAESVAR